MTELMLIDYLLFIDVTPEEESERETHIRGIIGIRKIKTKDKGPSNRLN